MISTKEKSTPKEGAGNDGAGVKGGDSGNQHDFKCPEVFNENVMSEEKHEGDEGGSHVNDPDGGNSKCKGSEAGAGLMCLRKIRRSCGWSSDPGA